MEFKVKHTEMNTAKDNLLKDQEALSDEIKSMKSQADKLRTIWKGKDSDAFFQNFDLYTSKMTNVNVVFGNLSKFIDSANKGYKEGDEALKKALEAEAAKYE